MFDKKAFLKAFIITFVFMLGFLTSNIYADMSTQTQNPNTLSSNLNTQKTLGDNRTDEVPSPSAWIADTQIGVYSQRVIIDVADPQWATFTDTHSMEPVISSRSYAIEVVPKYADGTIIHRVIQKNYDADGVYFILKGDNNPTQDPGKIRFDQVKRVVVAIIY
jgi:hypothetical protein